mmetsp:Transcript_6303/g.13639  ORF Transcript_6303/g.13639 Transcript_6303/m.13639 type:complete len:95 (+) Transcript_6303:1110-1394(+)
MSPAGTLSLSVYAGLALRWALPAQGVSFWALPERQRAVVAPPNFVPVAWCEGGLWFLLCPAAAAPHSTLGCARSAARRSARWLLELAAFWLSFS